MESLSWGALKTRRGAKAAASAKRRADLKWYGLAALSVGVALGFTLAFEHFHFRGAAVPLLALACAVNSWYGGRGPAVLAVVLSSLGFNYFFLEPLHTFYITALDLPYFLIFTSFASLLSWFGTIRRRADEALREQANLLNLTHDTIFVSDMDGVIKYWNRAAEERYGWTSEQAVGRVAHDLLKTAFPAPLEQIKSEVMRAGRWEGELVHTKNDGIQAVVASRWSLERGKRGEPVAILETNNDITESKKAEEALRRLNRELRAIGNCNQVLLHATDEQTLLDKICSIVCEEAGYRMAWVGYAEHDESKSVRPAAWSGAEEGYLANLGITWADSERGWGPTGTAIRSGKTACIQDFAADPRLAPWRESTLQHGFFSGIGLPLKDEHANVFGSLSIYSAQPNAFAPEEVRLLEELAGDLAFGIVSLRSRSARKHAEQEVALLSFALDKVREAAFLLDDTGRLHYANEEACRVLGYTHAELLGLSVPDVDSQFTTEVWSDHWRDLKTQQSLHFESRHRTRDGRIIPVEVSANYFEYGGRAYNLALVRDITEQKRAQDRLQDTAEALRQSEAYLAEAQRLSHTGSWAFDLAINKYIYASEECLRLFDVDTQLDLPTREAVFRKIHPEDWDRVNETFEKSLREKVDTEAEFRIVLANGTTKHIQVIRHPVLNDSGEVVKLVGTAMDITERRRAEEELRRTAAYLADAQQLTHTGAWASDRTTAPLYWSEEVFRIFGFDPQQGLPTWDQALQRVHREDRDRFWQSFQRTIHEKVNSEAEFRVVMPDGAVKQVHAVAHPVLNPNGELVEVVGTIVDITDRMRAEQERERLGELEAELAHINRVSMMGELATSIAHEVNQPLSGIVSSGSACLRWLAADPPNLDETRQSLRRIVGAGKHAAEVIARIRALTKKSAVPREKLDLKETIGEVLALVSNEARRNSVIVRTRFADDLSPVSGDRVQLQQVVLNLVMNGIEAMSGVSGRTRELVITTRNFDANQVQASVEDSGVGLDPNTLAKIFDSFYTTKPGGMGMGLSISRSILQAHGGRLWATGKEGPGAILHFTLPKYHKGESNAEV